MVRASNKGKLTLAWMSPKVLLKKSLQFPSLGRKNDFETEVSMRKSPICSTSRNNLSAFKAYQPSPRLNQFALLFASAVLSIHVASAQAPSLMWSSDVNATLFAADAQTNVYANANGTVIVLDGNGQPSQTNLICPVPSLAPGFAQRDESGNFYFAGDFDGTNNFGGTTLVGGWINGVNYNPPKWVPGYPTCYLAKYANDGALLWVVSFGVQAQSNYLSDLVLNADGSVTVAFVSGNQFAPQIEQYSSTGTKLWQSGVQSIPFDYENVKLSAIGGTNGGFLIYQESSHRAVGGFYATNGALAVAPVPAAYYWNSTLSMNGKPVTTTGNELYFAALASSSLQPTLQKSAPGGGIVWTQAIGSVEQWILGSDNGNLYLAGTNGIFSKYDTNGIQIWTTNYGAPAVIAVVDSSGNRFIQFSNNFIARIAADPPAVAPSIVTTPQSTTAFVGDNVSLSATASGTPPLYYIWQLNGTNLPVPNNSVLNLNSVTVTQTGPYTVIVTNSAGAVTSSPPAILRVKSVELYVGSQLLTNGTYVFASAPTITIRSAFTNGSSFYTLDASEPSFSSTYYSVPFILSQSATVRAIGYSADFEISEEADTANIIVLTRHTLTALSSGGGYVTLAQSSNPPPSDATSRWRGEGNTLDSVGTNNGTAHGGLTYGTGEVGQAFYLNGTDTDVTVAPSPTTDLGTSNGLTITTWFNADSVTTPASMVEWFDPGFRAESPDGVSFTVNMPTSSGGTGPGSLFANVLDTGGGYHVISTPTNQFNVGTFNHAALTYDKTSGIASIYLNGSLATQSNLGTFTPETRSAYFGVLIGGAHFPLAGHVAEWFAGSLDEVALYGRALSSSEIKSIYFAEGGVVSNPPSGSYVSTNVITVQAVPAPGWQFLYWLGDASGSAPEVQLTMDHDQSIYAVFGTTLSTTVVGNGQISLQPPGGLYAYGRTVRLTGIPQAGSYFGAWGNAASGNANPLYFTVTNPTPTVSSIFGTLSGSQAALTVKITGNGRVNANPQANVFSTGQLVTLTAVPDSGQSFLNWSGDASGTNNPLNVTMDQSKIITANFSGMPSFSINKQFGEGLSAEGFRFSMFSEPDSIYQLFCSTDLTSWQSLGLVTNQTGQLQILDSDATNYQHRYYRIVP